MCECVYLSVRVECVRECVLSVCECVECVCV